MTFRADAAKALVSGYQQIIESLETIANDPDKLAEVRCKTTGLQERLQTIETGFFAVFWNDFLDRVNAT